MIAVLSLPFTGQPFVEARTRLRRHLPRTPSLPFTGQPFVEAFRGAPGWW